MMAHPPVSMAEARRLAHARNASHGGHPGVTAYPRNAARAHEIGAIGELCIAQRYGFPMPRLRASGGDDGWDFLIELPHGVVMRMDVKTLRNARCLIAPDRAVARGLSNVYVMVHCDSQDCPHPMGWQHRSILARAQTFEHPQLGLQRSLSCELLRPMRDLDRLVNMRIAA